MRRCPKAVRAWLRIGQLLPLDPSPCPDPDPNPGQVRAWLRIGQMKITLKCPSLEARHRGLGLGLGLGRRFC